MAQPFYNSGGPRFRGGRRRIGRAGPQLGRLRRGPAGSRTRIRWLRGAGMFEQQPTLGRSSRTRGRHVVRRLRGTIRMTPGPTHLGRAAGGKAKFPTCRKVGKLTAAKKKLLPNSAFGLPEERSYPMPDPSHAKNAKSRAKTALKRKQLSRAKYDRIVRKADRVINACKPGRKAPKRRPARKRKRR